MSRKKLIPKYQNPAGPIEYVGMPKEEFDWMIYMFKNDPNNPQYKWFKLYAANKYGRQGNTQLPEVVIEAKRPEKTLAENAKENIEEVKQKWDNLPTDSKVDLALTAAGFFPGLDTVADVIDLSRSVKNGEWSNASLALLGLGLPVSGLYLKRVYDSINNYNKAKYISKMINKGIKKGPIEVPVKYFSSPSALYRKTIGNTEIDDVKRIGYFRTSSQSDLTPKELLNRSHGVSGWTRGYPFWHPKKPYASFVTLARNDIPHSYFEVDGAGKMFNTGAGGVYSDSVIPFESIAPRTSYDAWNGKQTGAIGIKPGDSTILGEETRLFTYNPNTGNYTYQGYIQPDKRIVVEFKNVEVGKDNRPATLERMNIHARIKPEGKSLFIDNFFNNPRNNQFISEYDPNYKWSPITYGDISLRGDFMFDLNDIGNTVTTINGFSALPYSMIKATYEHPKYYVNKFVELKQGGHLIPKHNQGNKVAKTFGIDTSKFTKNPSNTKLDNKDVSNPNEVRNKLTTKKHASWLNPRFINTRPAPAYITFPRNLHGFNNSNYKNT